MTTDRRAARRGLLTAVGAAAVGLWLPADRFRAPASWTPANTNWPLPRRDPARTAATPTPGPTASLDLVWETRVADRQLVGSLLVGDRGVVAATHDGVTVLARDGDLRRRVRSLGPFEAPLWVNALLGVDDGPLVRVDGGVYALDRRGGVRWRLSPSSAVDGSVFVGNTLLAGVGDSVVAVDTDTGLERWRAPGPLPAAWADGRLVGPDPDGAGLVALDTTTRRRDWHTREADPVGGVIAADRFVAVGETLAAYGLADGRRHWRRDTELTGPPATDGDRLFCVVDDRLLAVSVADGTTAWTCRVPELALAGPAVADDTVYAQTDRGVVAVDRETGTVLTRFVVRSSSGSPAAGPFVADGRLYLAFDETVYAVGGES